jgi:hypothetical protein
MMTYDIDKEYDSWLQEQADHLRDRAFDKLDIENLIEELEALVRGEKSAVESLVYQIFLHLLLINYWHEESEWNRNHWASEITGFRLQLNNKLTTNLKNHVLTRLDDLYQKARQAAINKTKSSVKGDRFPLERVYDFDYLIDDDFFGKNSD